MDLKRQVIQNEKALRAEIEGRVISPFNNYLLKLHKRTAEAITRCLGDNSKSDEQAYACKKRVETEFLRKQEHLEFYGKTLNKKMAGCLGNCRDDMTQELGECYAECLGNFKEYFAKLED
jgi:hypothetical protein